MADQPNGNQEGNQYVLTEQEEKLFKSMLDGEEVTGDLTLTLTVKNTEKDIPPTVMIKEFKNFEKKTHSGGGTRGGKKRRKKRRSTKKKRKQKQKKRAK